MNPLYIKKKFKLTIISKGKDKFIATQKLIDIIYYLFTYLRKDISLIFNKISNSI